LPLQLRGGVGGFLPFKAPHVRTIAQACCDSSPFLRMRNEE
jgi:hypothetical protein